MIDITLPIRTVNESNGQHGHWSAKSKRRKSQRQAVAWALHGRTLPPLPVVVLLTRISAGRLDEHDNLRGAMKSIVDEIAEHYAVHDKDRRFEWRYAQQKGKRGEHAVRITIETRAWP